MEYTIAIAVIIFVLWLEFRSDNRHKVTLAGISKLKIDYLEVMKQVRDQQISQKHYVNLTVDLQKDVKEIQYEYSKIKDQQRILGKQNRLLRENMVHRLDVNLPKGWSELVSKVNKQLGGLEQ